LGELLALRWRDVNFANSAKHVRQSFTNGHVDTPKSRQERTVPMAEEVAEALATLSQPDVFRADDDLVFCGGSLASRRSRATPSRSRSTLHELVRSRHLPHVRVGRGLRFTRSDLEESVGSHTSR
jgi:excisionase family DNA binding protein